jgi:nitrite reductase (NO-forming)/hydroxylamine reductase
VTNQQQSTNENLFLPTILALLFVLAAAALVWVTEIRPSIAPVAAEAPPAAPESAVAPAEPAGPVDLDSVIAIINKGGCIACHTIPGIPGAVGQVGPNLSNIGVDGAGRREGYTAEEYIRESLSEPSTFTAPECPTGPCITGTMPQLQLNEAEIEVLVSYLSTLGTN